MTDTKRQARPLYRVELVWVITHKRELWSNYLDLRAAEEAAYGLITSGHAVETEVFAVTDGGQKASVQRQLDFPSTTIRIPVPLNQIKRLSSIVCYCF